MIVDPSARTSSPVSDSRAAMFRTRTYQFNWT
jgi:hypothetical protein